ncbi:lipase [Cellulomonas shaoxiangyii]|uniref:Lipase n=1 Tax=Cellulomonas shaoxiangyii TaxID=2566013 RepID=A0A4V1CN41_9CELL|nr:lipase [Cellulomonas shaoxiangyii]TGY82828.1 lipase [Cellulomonas shaoxiangyii]
MPDARVEVRGAAWFEPTADGVLPHRLPAWTRAQFPDAFVAMCDEQPAGVRLRLRTAARRLTLHVRTWRVATLPHAEPAPPERFEVVVDGRVAGSAVCTAAGVLTFDPGTATTAAGPAPVGAVAFTLPDGAGTPADVEVWLPYRERVALVAVVADAPVLPPAAVDAPRWVHHGSSISQGANADVPTGTWPVVAARTAGLDLVNLGLSGNAVLDPFVARAIRDQPADVVSVKLGINVVNHDAMRRRAFGPAVHGFLDTVREGHPTTPLVVVSPVLCPLVEDVPGPTSIDPDAPDVRFRTAGRASEVAEGKLSLRVVREVLAAVVAARRDAGDAALAYVDGRTLYGDADAAELPTADLLHPDAAAQRRMGERFAAVLRAL